MENYSNMFIEVFLNFPNHAFRHGDFHVWEKMKKVCSRIQENFQSFQKFEDQVCRFKDQD